MPATARCPHRPLSTRHDRRSVSVTASSTAAASIIRTVTNSSGDRYRSPTREAMNEELHNSTKANGTIRTSMVSIRRADGGQLPPYAVV